MWQFQWMFSLIPDSLLVWIYSFVLVTGVILYFGSFLCKYWPFKMIPVLGQFPVLGKLIGGLLVVLGIFLFGGYANEQSWRDRVADLEEKIKASEAKSVDANTKIETKFKEKTKIVKQTQVVIQERIVKEAVKIDADCKVPQEAIDILNKAAETPKQGESK